MNQTAQHLARHGRNGDTMLVHMSPKEVGGLQALARSNGGTLTINPHTGLPEAFSLGRLLPMAAGAALTAFSGGTLSPLTIGLMTGGIGALATGSLKEGLLMGLGAAGGAGLAGSMANLAAPAASTSMGAAGASGLTAPVSLPPPVATAPLDFSAGAPSLSSQVTANAMPAANYSLTSNMPPLGAEGGLQAARAPMVDLNAGNITPAQNAAITSSPGYNPNISANSQYFMQNPITSASYAMPPQPTVGLTGPGVSLASTASPPPLDFAEPLGPQLAGRYPVADYSLTGAPASPPPPSYGSRIWEGGKAAFSSPEAAGEFLSNNKMNLAMSASPAVFEEKKYDQPESDSYIRPYSLDVENTSDAPVSRSGTEERRVRYRYTAQEPYKAAEGGIVAFARGGQNRQDSEAMMLPDAGRFDPTMQPIALPRLDQQTPMQYAEGGQTRGRKKIDRMDDPYTFAAYQSGRGLYDAAIQNFAQGGLGGQPRFLSGGGDGMSDSIPATINGNEPARLADGEFVIPADVVSHLGNGSSKAGADQLYGMMDRIRKKRTGKKRQAPAVNPKRLMPA